jgi:hypothetical protein
MLKLFKTYYISLDVRNVSVIEIQVVRLGMYLQNGPDFFALLVSMSSGSHGKRIDNCDRLAGISVTHIKMEFGRMAETCESAYSGADVNTQEVKGFSPTSEVIKNSTRRKSFSKRRSTCFDSLGVYFSV